MMVVASLTEPTCLVSDSGVIVGNSVSNMFKQRANFCIR